MAGIPAEGSEEADRRGQVKRDTGPDVTGAAAPGGHLTGTGRTQQPHRGGDQRGADPAPLTRRSDQHERDASRHVHGGKTDQPHALHGGQPRALHGHQSFAQRHDATRQQRPGRRQGGSPECLNLFSAAAPVWSAWKCVSTTRRRSAG